MKKIIIILMVALGFAACSHTKVRRIGRITREIRVIPFVSGSMSELDLLMEVLRQAKEKKCESIEIIDIMEDEAIGRCYYNSNV